MNQLPSDESIAPIIEERKGMSISSLLKLNGCVLLIVILSSFFFTGGWGAILGIILGALLFVIANGFMFFKALWRREYLIAILYLILAAGAALFYSSIG